MIYIGIDPGESGGMAITDGSLVQAWKMPATERDTYDLLRELCDQSQDVCVYLESVSAMPGQGVTSMFKFGQSFGFLRGLILALKVPLHDVRPQVWQKEFGLIQWRRKGEAKPTQTEKKNRNKQKAQQLWPHLKITHATADSLLIAEYGRRVNANRA